MAEVNGEVNEAAAWRVTWRVELGCCYQTQYQPFLREANYSRSSISSPPTPGSPLCEPIQPRDRPPVHRLNSVPLPLPPEPEKATSPTPPEAEEPPSVQTLPSQPSPSTTTTPSLPPSPPTDQAPTATNGRPNRAPSCSKARHGRAHRRPLSSTRRGQARRARRAVDPAVQQRAMAFASTRAAPVYGASADSSSSSTKRIYTREQLVSLRPQGPPLHVAAPCFVPHASRYSCYARAVRLGLADPMPPRTFAFRSVPTGAAQEMLVRVHVAATMHTAS